MDFRDQGTLRRRWEGSYNQELYSQLSDSLRFGHIHIRRRPKRGNILVVRVRQLSLCSLSKFLGGKSRQPAFHSLG